MDVVDKLYADTARAPQNAQGRIQPRATRT